jgi:hydroxymethylpyrimidine pyrophosphatase-like HAD family hydrolase
MRPGEVIAVGDGTSDIPMFREAGYAVGFGQVTDEVRRAADTTTGEDIASLVGLLTGIRSA